LQIRQLAEKERDTVIALRRHFHENPELSQKDGRKGLIRLFKGTVTILSLRFFFYAKRAGMERPIAVR
jgi:hypothetical protein